MASFKCWPQMHRDYRVLSYADLNLVVTSQFSGLSGSKKSSFFWHSQVQLQTAGVLTTSGRLPNSKQPFTCGAVLEDAQFDSSPSSRILQLQAHPNYLCRSDLRHMHSNLVHGGLNHVKIAKDEETRTNRGRGSDIKTFEPVRVCSLLSFCQMSKSNLWYKCGKSLSKAKWMTMCKSQWISCATCLFCPLETMKIESAFCRRQSITKPGAKKRWDIAMMWSAYQSDEIVAKCTCGPNRAT